MQARAVATKEPNPLGIYDVHGNVWEWVEDQYGNYPNRSVTDPTGSKSGPWRIIRGGNWNHTARYLRSAYRDRGKPDSPWNGLGFRLVRTPNN